MGAAMANLEGLKWGSNQYAQKVEGSRDPSIKGQAKSRAQLAERGLGLTARQI